MHLGPPVHDAEIHSAREFLRQNDFSPASDYFNRLWQIQNRLVSRAKEPPVRSGKRNYGGEAAGYWLQLQSAYDHVIISTCYEGDFNLKHGRVKISHRFNEQGRIDFVELKFLRSLEPCLTGEIRKLLTVNGYQNIRKDWHVAEAFVLPLLPRELIFLYEGIFKCPRHEVLAWLVNVGHRIANDLLEQLRLSPANGCVQHVNGSRDQLGLSAVRTDEVAMPVLTRAAALEVSVDFEDDKTARVSYAGA